MSGKKTLSLLFIAGALGVAGAGLAMLYINAREAELIEANKPKSEPVPVVVASKDLVKGDILDTSTLSVRNIPGDYVDANAITPGQFESIQGQVLTQNLNKGKALLRSFIGQEFPLDFSDTIRPLRRAMTIQIDETNSISGLIRPGNHVDIFVNLPPSAGASSGTGSNEVMPVLENVEVLTTGRDTAYDYEEKIRLIRAGYGVQPDQNFTTLTLNVTPKEAALITIAKDKGDLLALLRNRKDDSASGFTSVSADSIKTNANSLAAAAQARKNAKALGKLSTDANGNVVLADGTVLKGATLREDGMMVLADGTVVDPNDVYISSDGTVMRKDGTALAGVSTSKSLGALKTDANGNVVLADGTVLTGATLREDGMLVMADGTVVDPNDVVINADGTVTRKDGSALALKAGKPVGKLGVDADGNVVLADGTVLSGATLREDGMLVLADGTVVDPDDVIINADGTISTKDGTLLAGVQTGTVAGALNVDANGNIVTANGVVLKGATLREDGMLVLADGTVVDPDDVIINADGTVSTKDGKVLKGLIADASNATNSSVSTVNREVDYIVGGVSEDSVATVKKVPVVE